MIHNLKGRRIFYIFAAVLCVALLAGAMLAVNVMAADGPGGQGPGSGGQGSSGYSQHIDVRLVTDDFEFTQTITESSTQKITVNKTWADEADHNSDTITVYLTDSTGRKITDSSGNCYTATLSADGDWTASWSDLTLEAGNYSAVEDEVKGYTSLATIVTVAEAGSSTMTVTVEGSLELTDINSTLTYTHNGTTYTTTGYTDQTDTLDEKTVYEYHFENSATSNSGSGGGGGQQGTSIALSDGDTITVVVTFKATYTVYDSDGNVIASATDKTFTDYEYTETVDGDNNYCSGSGYDFYIYPEELLEEIISEESKTITITNTPSTVDIPVTKTWSGDDDYTDIRPSSVTVTVYNGDTAVKTLTLSENNSWSGTFEDLPEYDTSNGATNAKKIEYTVKETAVTGYTTSYSTADDGKITITNTLKIVSVPVTKTWVDGNGYYRPKSVTVTLYADGETTNQTLTLNSDNNWLGTFSDLPMYGTDNNGTVSEIKYTVEETAVDNYNSSVTYNTDGSVTITNTLKTATVNLTKTVSGNMGDTAKKFTFTVSYVDTNGTTQTATYNLSDEESSGNITVPYGAAVTITESSNDGYTVTATVNSKTETVTNSSLSFTVAADSYEVVVDNYKSIDVDTGVVLESIPYIAILAVVVVGGVVLLRRRGRDED